jgi:transcriptional regulator with XRE-family HTH domain
MTVSATRTQNKIALGQRIREERRRRYMSQDVFASAVGLSGRAQTRQIELGERVVDSSLLCKIAEALRVPMDAFFDKERGRVLAAGARFNAKSSRADKLAMQPMEDYALELLADIEFAEREVAAHGW